LSVTEPAVEGLFDRETSRQVTLEVGMDDRVAKVSEVIHRPAETHHVVFGIVDGTDDDWASWYSDWLVNLSELPALLGSKPVRSELTYLLVSLDKDYTASQPGEPWETYYAQRIFDHFGSSER